MQADKTDTETSHRLRRAVQLSPSRQQLPGGKEQCLLGVAVWVQTPSGAAAPQTGKNQP